MYCRCFPHVWDLCCFQNKILKILKILIVRVANIVYSARSVIGSLLNGSNPIKYHNNVQESLKQELLEGNKARRMGMDQIYKNVLLI